MSILWNSALTRADLRILGNNLGDAIHDRTVRRRRHYRRLLKSLHQYLATVRRREEWHLACSSMGRCVRHPQPTESRLFQT
jgi:hypothetical protein